MGHSHSQQPVFRLDDPCDLGDRSPLLQPERGQVVGLDLGALPGGHAVCRPLGMGYISHYLSLLLGAGTGAALAAGRNSWTLGCLWDAVGIERTEQSRLTHLL